DHGVHPVEIPRGKGLPWLPGEGHAIDDGRARARCAPDRARRHAAKAGCPVRGVAPAHVRSEGRARGVRLFPGRQDRLAVLRLESGGNAGEGVVLAALADRLVEQPSGRGRRELVTDARPTRRFAEDGDVVRIASKRPDVAPHPAHRRLLILEPVVAGMRAKSVVRQKAKDAEAVVRRGGTRRAYERVAHCGPFRLYETAALGT